MARKESVVEQLNRLTRVLQNEQRERSKLAPVQLQTLHFLARCNRYSDNPSAVAEYLEITKGTASQTIGVLEREGLLVKEIDPDDRRSVRLRLTAAGRRLAKDTGAAGIEQLPARELERVRQALDHLLKAIQRAGGGRSFGVCHSCRHYTRLADGSFQCGLTGEPLTADDSEKICREHEPAAG